MGHCGSPMTRFAIHLRSRFLHAPAMSEALECCRGSISDTWDTSRQGRLLTMDDATSTFIELRPRLLGIAYRMLGSVAEAEEVVQDVWLKWQAAERGAVDSSQAWLVAVTTRTSIDRLRAAKVERQNYPG